MPKSNKVTPSEDRISFADRLALAVSVFARPQLGKAARALIQKAVPRKFSEHLGIDPGEETWGRQPEQDLQDFIDVVGNHVWAYVAIRCIARNAKKVKKIVEHREPVWDDTIKGVNSDNWVEAPQSIVAQLFDQPNRWTTWPGFVEKNITYLQAVGATFIESAFLGGNIDLGDIGRKRPPIELYTLMAQHVIPIPDPKRMFHGFIARVNGKDITFDAREITPIMYFNPKDPFNGMSPMQAAVAELTQDFWAIGYNRDFFKNSGRPEGILKKTEGRLSKEAYARLIEWWKQNHQGVGRQHRLMLLEEGLEYQATALSQKDMEFIELRKMTREAILAVYGVPPIMVGLLEHASYSNAREQKETFWEDTMCSILDHFFEALNVQIVWPYFGKDYRIRYDTEGIKALQEDEEIRSNRARADYQAGGTSLNEFRKERGYPAYPHELADKVMIQPTGVPIDQYSEVAASMAPPPGALPEPNVEPGVEPAARPGEAPEAEADQSKTPDQIEDEKRLVAAGGQVQLRDR